MKEHFMRFGDYIRQKRVENPREITMQDVATHLGVSLPYVSEVEKNRRNPFDGEKLEALADFLDMSEADKAKMYDLAGRESQAIPHDIKDTFLYEPVGDLARVALRRSKAGFITEEDWKAFLRQKENNND
jgi:transcriptional regulator with XRE-family HTH domain